MNDIFITSDTHFCHDKDFIYQPRGFQCVSDMNKTIITNINAIVGHEDILYILGDVMLGNNEEGLECLAELNGHKKIIIGNHCTDNRIKLYKTLPKVEVLGYGERFSSKKISLLLTHYPTIVNNVGPEKPIWNLCGHSHTKNRWDHAAFGCYHCELDAHDNKPILLNDLIDEVKEYSE